MFCAGNNLPIFAKFVAQYLFYKWIYKTTIKRKQK